MAKRSLQLPLTRGLWTKRAANEVPEGALTYARDCVYKAGASGLRKRDVHLDLDSSALAATGHGITQFQTTDGTVDNLVVHAGAKVYKAATSTSPTFADEGNDLTDAGPTTFVQYNDRLYISNGATDIQVVDKDGAIDRTAGLPQPGVISIELGTSGTGTIDVTNAYHVTYRLFDQANNVYSDPPTTDNGGLFYQTLLGPLTDKLFITVDNITTTIPGGTEATHLVILMTSDEVNPTTFYPVKMIPLDSDVDASNSGLNIQPNSSTKVGTRNFGSPQNVYDNNYLSNSSASIEMYDNGGGDVTSIASLDNQQRWDFPASSSANWELVVSWDLSGYYKSPLDNDGASDAVSLSTAKYHILLEYSKNSGGDWVTIYEDTDTLAGVMTAIGKSGQTSSNGRSVDYIGTMGSPQVSSVSVTSTDTSTLQFRALLEPTAALNDIFASVGVRSEYISLRLGDVRVVGTGFGGTINDGSLYLAVGDIPNGAETPFVNSSNIGQYQQPPQRLFHNVVFEGHLLGKSDDNGLFLAYSLTDEPEHWSTNPNLAAYPYLIPFKEKEADDLVGADKVANQLIVFATDSVWRINHLPVLSDPNGSLASLFAEARSTVKRRVTDTVGCVGVRAYARMQLSSDEDFVFFWSRLGPMITDGFRVWRAADHVDWSWLNADQTKCVVTNNTADQRVEVELRSSSGSVNDVAYLFQYDPENLITQQGKGFRMNVLGPHPRKLADTAEIRKSDGTKEMVAIDSQTSDGSTYRLYAATSGTDAIQAADFNWTTGRIGAKGREAAFDKMVFNVDETGSRTRAIGDTTITPDVPLDKDPLNIDQAGQSLEVEWNDDTVTFRIVDEDEQEIDANQGNESVAFTTSSRVINSATLFYDDGEEIKD